MQNADCIACSVLVMQTDKCCVCVFMCGGIVVVCVCVFFKINSEGNSALIFALFFCVV